MTAAQKRAWYNLVVVAGSLLVVVLLVPVLGPGAQGGFGLLGLLGLSPLLFRRRAHAVQSDERDREIQRRAALVAYSVFWVLFVAVCVGLPFVYGWDGSVPVAVVQASVWVGLMLLVGVTAGATLVQYGRAGAGEAGDAA